MGPRGIPDLSSLAWNGLPPANNKKLATIIDLYAFTEGAAIETANWYMHRRVSPSRNSKALRAGAAVSVVIGAVLPLIHSVAPSWISAEWGFVFLALGGGAVLLDRTFGYSASWTRYTRAGLSLQCALASSRVEFTEAYIAADADSPAELEINTLIRVIENLQETVSGIVLEETNAWMGYLAESLEELTRSTARHAEISRTRKGVTAN
ncbi:SLATT domain-containing protein [Streptomyces prunicolor]|uniref:SLATT domain-containing protein n=1 Tax=Streptomyces prunicolor TaxID=67348 RepID=UPI0033F1556A